MGLWRNLVAQLLCMQKVMGSNPVLSTKEIHTATKYILMVRTKRISINYNYSRVPELVAGSGLLIRCLRAAAGSSPAPRAKFIAGSRPARPAKNSSRGIATVASQAHILKVVGSNPTSAIKTILLLNKE